mmetsp:Transcript_90525/g.242416  ORF Transcript_90525/g.242416 Transcript_90525/m.242416 type:complete len:285 (-) Transcript_90525:46-900(-)
MHTRTNQFAVDNLLDHRVETMSQHPSTPANQGRASSKRIENSSKLDRDVASSYDHRSFWLLRQVEEIVTCDRVLPAGDLRLRGRTTGCNQDMVGGEDVIAHLDCSSIQKTRIPNNMGNSGVIQVSRINGVEPFHVCVSFSFQRWPINLRWRPMDTITFRDSVTLNHRSCREHHFLGHTSHVDTCPTQASSLSSASVVTVHTTFYNSNFLAVCSRTPCRSHTTAAAANHQIIKVRRRRRRDRACLDLLSSCESGTRTERSKHRASCSCAQVHGIPRMERQATSRS